MIFPLLHWLSSVLCTIQSGTESNQPLRGTSQLTLEEDIASYLVSGVDRFLLSQLDQSVSKREEYWKRDFSSTTNYAVSVEPNRMQLSQILGIRDNRIPFKGLELIASTNQPALVGRGNGYDIFAVRWPVIHTIHGEGLLLVPSNKPIANVIAIPDADVLPEHISGLIEGVPSHSQFARHLAESGCRVVIPTLISRKSSEMPNHISKREWLYRSAFELGRHLIGYELQKIFAVVDWFSAQSQDDVKIGTIGWGEGGMLALYAGAIDTRIDAVCVSGYFNSRQEIWKEPLERNVFGLLTQFGDAELASMVAPRHLIIEASDFPEVHVPSGTGGAAPADLVTPALDQVKTEVERAQSIVKKLNPKPQIELIQAENSVYGTVESLQSLLDLLSTQATVSFSENRPEHLDGNFQPDRREDLQLAEIDQYNQWLLGESSHTRQEFFSKLDTSSLGGYQQTIEWYRDFFSREIIGQFDLDLLPFNARSRFSYQGKNWQGYEVVLDVWPDVIAYGILLLPNDIKEEERRPVVVCQHGLEGRPQDIIQGDHDAYHDFAAKLAERGFITFSPQNLYIFTDRFRTLQRKANPIQKTLFSIIIPQHQQIVNWLQSLSYVDPNRIAFYGLSYGGKTAMRVPPLVTDYCLSICSADFNEWVWKNASTRSSYSYVNSGEYEIFEFDLGSTFNYAEMSWLICPRPFMVERGHFDGVAPDETVAYEYAKVKRQYDLLGIGNRTEMEVFNGPHTINGIGTFEFLHQHLNWPVKKA